MVNMHSPLDGVREVEETHRNAELRKSKVRHVEGVERFVPQDGIIFDVEDVAEDSCATAHVPNDQHL